MGISPMKRGFFLGICRNKLFGNTFRWCEYNDLIYLINHSYAGIGYFGPFFSTFGRSFCSKKFFLTGPSSRINNTILRKS
jgi:hypothetical protein